MTGASSPEPRRGPWSTFVGLALLVGSCVLSVLHPWVGVPALLAMLVGGFALVVWQGDQERRERARRRAELVAVAAPRGEAWRKLLAHLGQGAWVEQLASEARWALRVEATDSDVRSQFGGEPLLPAAFEWPTHDGEPLGFLGQLDLSEVSAALPEWPGPKEGLLSFFGGEALWSEEVGAPTAARVVHVVGEPARTAVPKKVQQAWRFEARKVAFVRFEDPPIELVPIDEAEAFEAVADVRELLGSGATGATRVLGHADPIQERMELPCELASRGLPPTTPLDDERGDEIRRQADRWRLLLQLDEGAPGMRWGDAGLVYFWIRDEDLAAGRFERARAVIQHH